MSRPQETANHADVYYQAKINMGLCINCMRRAKWPYRRCEAHLVSQREYMRRYKAKVPQ